MPSDTKTCERTEGAAAAVQAKHGDSCFAYQVALDPMSSTSFGDDFTKPPALPCSRDDVLVDNGAAAPKTCLIPVEMRTLTAAGGLLPAGTALTATRTTFDQPLIWFCPIEEISSRTSNRYATNKSSFWKTTILQTKSTQTLVFNCSGSTGRLRACLFCGNVARVALW